MKRKDLMLTLSTVAFVVCIFHQLGHATSPSYPAVTSLTWSFGATIPNAHQEGTSAVANNQIYVISGADQSCSDTGGGTPTTAVDIYDPPTNTFIAGPSVNLARHEYPMAVTVGNSVFLIGGTQFCGGATVTPVEKLDLTTNVWTVLSAASDLPAPLDGAFHCGAAHGNQIYYFESTGIGVFDTTTNTWTVMSAPPLLTPSLFCRATTVGDQIVITGPGNGSADSNSQRILIFSVNTGNMTLASAITVSLAEHTSALLFGSVVVAGGDFSGETSVQSISDIRCALCITPASTVTTLTPLPDTSDDAVGGVVSNKYYILGGHNSAGSNMPPVLIGTP